MKSLTPTPGITRRHLLLGSLGLLGAGGVVSAMLREPVRSGTLLSAYEDARGDQFVGGLKLGSGEVFGAHIPMRAHGNAIDPRDSQRVIFFARRPGTQAFELRLDTLRARTIFATPSGRHLAGHGVFSSDGEVLFTPEHDFEHARGVLAVRDARDFRIVAEFDTHGIDPHEVALLPTGRHLLVANGGIMTHPRTFRRKLNIATMDPSLVVLDAHSGACLEQLRLPDHLLSIRHMAVSVSGTAAIGLQYEGDTSHAPSTVAFYDPSRGFKLLDAPATERTKFRAYIASIAASESHDLIAAACPYGNGVACWSLRRGEYLGFIDAVEPYGLSRLADGSIATSQRDGRALALDESRLRSQFLNLAGNVAIRWDDHWVALA